MMPDLKCGACLVGFDLRDERGKRQEHCTFDGEFRGPRVGCKATTVILKRAIAQLQGEVDRREAKGGE